MENDKVSHISLTVFLENLLSTFTVREKMKSLIEQYENDDNIWLDETLEKICKEDNKGG